MGRLAAIVALAPVVLLAAACGGGRSASSVGGHTYMLAAAQQDGAGKGIYFTIISPVPIPTGLLTKHGATVVAHVNGPRACSFTKTVTGTRGRGAFLSGKEVTVTINGSNPFVSMVCGLLKKTPFTSTNIEGS